MKRTMLKAKLSLTLLLLLFTTALWSKESGEKEIHHDLQINSNALFEVNNIYGDLIVTTEENRTKATVDILIRLSERNHDRVEKFLDEISVELQSDPDHIKLKTIINKRNGSYNDLEINYTVRLPKNVRVNLKNRYGSVVVNQLYKESEIEVHYGNLKVDKYHSESNKVKLMYTDMKVNTASFIDLYGRYSDVVIKSLDQFKGDLMYTDCRIERCPDFSLVTRYGDLKLKNTRVAFVDGMYADMEFDNIELSLNAITRYGDLEVNEINKEFKGIEIDGMYSEIELGFESGSVFILSGDLSYADLSLPNDAKVIRKAKSGAQYEIEAYSGETKSVEKRVKIESRYGDVTIR